MTYSPIIISGRPGSGKTEIIVSFCNMHPSSTLLIAEEYDADSIRKRGLSRDVKVMGIEEAMAISVFGYKTICIDYIELIEKDLLEKLIAKAKSENIRLIAVSQMRRDYQVNNPFA